MYAGVPKAARPSWCLTEVVQYHHSCPYTRAQGAATIVHLATARRETLPAGSSGDFFVDCAPYHVNPLDTKGRHRDAYASTLFNMTARMVHDGGAQHVEVAPAAALLPRSTAALGLAGIVLVALVGLRRPRRGQLM